MRPIIRMMGKVASRGLIRVGSMRPIIRMMESSTTPRCLRGYASMRPIIRMMGKPPDLAAIEPALHSASMRPIIRMMGKQIRSPARPMLAGLLQ